MNKNDHIRATGFTNPARASTRASGTPGEARRSVR